MRQVEAYLGKLLTKWFKRYPFLIKMVSYLFTIFDSLCLYVVSRVNNLLYRLDIQYPWIDSIILFIYSQYISVVNGNVSKPIVLAISIFVAFHSTFDYWLFNFVLLSCAALKEWFVKNDRIKKIIHSYINIF